jgi:cytochrome c oxidase assembly factor CtaG
MNDALPVASAAPAGTLFLPVLVLAYWIPYRARARTLAGRGRAVPAWRRHCFLAGLIVCGLALSPPLGGVSQQLLTAHMVEHLLIGDIAALLLVLGLTGPMLQPLLRIRAVDRVRFLLYPPLALALWALDFYIWHLPVLYQAALRHDPIHALEHACFLAFGMLMWMALLGPLPKPAWFGNFAKLGYIIAVRLIGTALGNFFIFSGTVFYPYYAAGDARWHVNPLTDQSIAGAVMMLEESLLTVGLFCWLFLKAAREGEERQELIELAQQAGFPLTEERAARAVAAGRTDEIRRRLGASTHLTGQRKVNR